MAVAASERSHQEPFTMYPNRYIDYIKANLTDTERDICDVVIRMTYGWHRRNARISNTTFMAKTGKSEPSIIRAKRSLAEMGLLVILKHGGGSETALYTLDLYYDQPSRTEDIPPGQPPIPPQEMVYSQEDETKTHNICPPMEETTQPAPSSEVEEPAPSSDATTDCSTHHDPDIHQDIQVVEGQPKYAVVDQDPAGDSSTPQISDTERGPSPISISDEATTTPNTTLAPSNDQEISINIKNKTNIEDTGSSEDTTNQDRVVTRAAVATVRNNFNNLFPEAQEDDDYPFYGWLIKTYGLQNILDRLAWMREYRKWHPILNPKGLLRMALVNDYVPSVKIEAKLRADQVAMAEAQRFRQECQEREKEIANFDYEAAQRNLQELLESLN